MVGVLGVMPIECEGGREERRTNRIPVGAGDGVATLMSWPRSVATTERHGDYYQSSRGSIVRKGNYIRVLHKNFFADAS